MAKYQIVNSFWVDENLHVKAILTTASPKWYLQYNKAGRGNGRQKRQSLKTTSKKEARLRGYAFARDFAGGRIVDRQLNRVTVGQVSRLKLERMKALGRTPRSIEGYARYYATAMAFLPDHENEPLMDLTPLVLERLENALRTTGVKLPDSPEHTRKHKARALAPKTILETMKAIRGLLKFAKKRSLLERDPSEGYELPPGPSAEIETFTAQELGQIFADPDLEVAPIWKFLVMSCLRIGELTWLTKSDVMLDDNGQPSAIHIRKKTCPFTGVTWQPKHGVERIVPLVPEAAEILTKAFAASSGPWAFESSSAIPTGNGRWTEDKLRWRFNKQLKACGITHGHPHVCRHTGASYLANVEKIPIPLLQKYLGHRDITTTMRYLHAKPTDVAEALKGCDFSRLSLPAFNVWVAGVNNTAPTSNIPHLVTDVLQEVMAE